MSSRTVQRPSRYKPFRLLRRVLALVGIILLVAICAFAVLAAAMHSETFWRRAIIPKVTGPYWDTVVHWESFSPQMFPPGITAENVVFHEPGPDGLPVIQVRRLRVLLTYRSRPGFLDIARLDADGVSLNYVIEEDGESNWEKAVDRLFQGRMPPPPGYAGPLADPRIPRIMLRHASVRDYSVRVENRREGGAPLIYSYQSLEPLRIVLAPDAERFSPGRVDNYLRLESTGRWTLRHGDTRFRGRAIAKVTAPGLSRFPRNLLEIDVRFFDPAERAKLRFSGTVPLERIPFRPSAVPLHGLQGSLAGSQRSNPLLLFREGMIDPLYGTVRAEWQLDARAEELAGFVEAFQDPQSGAPPPMSLLPEAVAHLLEDALLQASGNLEGRGILQYALVDPRERVPVSFASAGEVHFRARDLERLRPFLAAIPPSRADRAPVPIPVTVSFSWKASADESPNEGTFWGAISARSDGIASGDIEIDAWLTSDHSPEEPLRLRPFGVDVMETLGSWGNIPLADLPDYDWFPEWEMVIGETSRAVKAAVHVLDELSVENAALRQRLEVTNSQVMQGMLHPVFGPVDRASSASLELSLVREGVERPVRIQASLEAEGVVPENLPGEVDLGAHADLSLTGPILSIHGLELRMDRERYPGPQEAESLMIRLADGAPGHPGPPRPTWIDLQTGVGQFELIAETLSPAVIDALLRIRPLGTGERLSSPFGQQVLEILGFARDSEVPGTRASLYFSGNTGRHWTMTSVLPLENVPLRNFLLLDDEAPTLAETFDVLFAQSATLDRLTGLFRPHLFDLSIHASSDGARIARISLEPEAVTELSHDQLIDFLFEEVDQLARGILTSPKLLKELVSGALERFDRLHDSTVQGGGKIAVTLPAFDLSVYREGLAQTGIPITGGVLNLRFETAFGEQDVEHTGVTGNFALSGVTFEGIAEPLPPLEGRIRLQHDEERLWVRELSTRLAFWPGRPATRLHLSGWASRRTEQAEWFLSLEDVNEPVFDLLERIRLAGVGPAASIQRHLPLARLAEAAGSAGSISLYFHASADETGEEIALTARQEGRLLDVFPPFLAPLSFDLFQSLEIDGRQAVTLTGLRGEVREDGGETLATLTLESPVPFGAFEDASGPVTLTLASEKNLGGAAEYLARFPLPLFHRAVTGGIARGKLSVEFPRGVFAGASRDFPIRNSFDLVLEDLQLEGFTTPIVGSLSGAVSREGSLIALESLVLNALVGGEPAGGLEAEAVYDLRVSRLRGTVDLVDLRPRLLEALPGGIPLWLTHRPDTVLNLRATIETAPHTGRAAIDTILRVRHFGLPAVVTATPGDTGREYFHPPLHLDGHLAFEYSIDSPLTEIKALDVLAGTGELPAGNRRLDPLPPTVRSLVRASLAAPFAFDLMRGEMAAATPEGAGVFLDLGPVPMEGYGPVLRRLVGFPLVAGTLRGTGSFLATGEGPRRLDLASLEIGLTEGRWESVTGERRPVEASVRLAGSRRAGVIRLDDLTIRLDTPGVDPFPPDHVQLRGYYRTTPERHFFDAELDSTGITLDRFFYFARDAAAWRALAAAAAPDANAPRGRRTLRQLEIPDYVEAYFDGELNNLRYRHLFFPRTTMRAVLEDRQIHLQEFRSRLREGSILIGAHVDMRTATMQWHLQAALDNLEARHWFDSFAPAELAGTVRGTLDLGGEFSGRGFDPGQLARHMRGNVHAKLKQGRVDHKDMRYILGTEGALEANLHAAIQSNRALFELTTPWNPSREVLAQGVLFNLLGMDDKPPHLRAVVDFTRTTAVGPPWRRMEQEGRTVPFRQDVFGVLMELQGPLGPPPVRPSASVRTLRY